MEGMKDEVLVRFLFCFCTTVDSNDPSHTPLTVNSRLCVIYRSQDTAAVYPSDTSLSLVWEKPARCRKLSDRCL